MKQFISIGDFQDVFYKIKEKGFPFILSKFRLLPKERIASKWNQYVSESDFWVIPEIQQHWNKIISGNPNVNYEEYVCEKYLSDKKGLKLLSVGCGEGYHERNFAKHIDFDQIDGIDFSPESIKAAQKFATANDLNINYFHGDFKKHHFEHSYDVILFSSSLHHFTNVNETLKKHVISLLKPDGILVVFEYVGPNRLHWTKEQLKAANSQLQRIPETYRVRNDKTTIKRKVYRPGILRMLMVDPSEAVDSESIIPGLQEHFAILEQKDLGWNLLHLSLKGIAHNFVNENPETKKLIASLLEEESDFVQKIGKADAIFGVYQSK